MAIREGTGDFVYTRATMMDDMRDLTPFVEAYTSEALPCAKTPAVHSFDQFPPMERYPELVAEFAASRESTTTRR